MSLIVFYCNDNLKNIQSMEYYRQDILAIKSLGHEVVLCNRYRDIPLRFDCIFVWWWTYALYPVLLARFLGRKSIVTGVFNFRFESNTHGRDYFNRPGHQRILMSLAARLADINLFVSEIEYSEVSKYFRLKRAFYYPCAVDNAYFEVGQRSARREGSLNIAWSGNENLKRKGVWDILEAMVCLKRMGVLHKLVLAGKAGDGLPDLREKVAELGLENQVTVVGEVSMEDKLRLFATAKLYLQPSYYEGFGLATAEAMAAGCCVLTCDVGEVRNVVGDGGCYVQPGDPEGLAQAVKNLLDDENRIEALKQQASLQLHSKFSYSRKVASLGGILRSFL
jgi:glycosyltransferase involved in cell wall biosynthesis